MRERPIADLIGGLQQLDARVACAQETLCPKVVIEASGGLRGGNVDHDGNIRSEVPFVAFLYSLLLRLLVLVEIRAVVCDALILEYPVYSKQHSIHVFLSTPLCACYHPNAIHSTHASP